MARIDPKSTRWESLDSPQTHARTNQNPTPQNSESRKTTSPQAQANAAITNEVLDRKRAEMAAALRNHPHASDALRSSPSRVMRTEQKVESSHLSPSPDSPPAPSSPPPIFRHEHMGPEATPHIPDEVEQYIPEDDPDTTNHPMTPPYDPSRSVDSLEEPERPFHVGDSIPPGYERISLPSGFVTYPFRTLGIRPFTVMEMIDASNACAMKDRMALHDVVAQTITEDLRSLWWNDYLYILAYHRMNSYIDNPFEVHHESIYGNKVTHTVKTTLLNRNLHLTGEDVLLMQQMGIRLPTVMDAELVENHTFDSPMEAARWNVVQFLPGKSMKEKMENLSSLTPQGLSLISRINRAIVESGPFEWVQVRDPNIDLDTPQKDLNRYRRNLRQLIRSVEENIHEIDNLDVLTRHRFLDRLSIAKEALRRLTAGDAEPVLETIYLPIEEMNFLPSI